MSSACHLCHQDTSMMPNISEVNSHGFASSSPFTCCCCTCALQPVTKSVDDFVHFVLAVFF